MIIALAGRRIDEKDALPARFPLANRDAVRGRLRQLFREHGASTLVASGACGADLLALEVAGELGLRRIMVIPSGRDRFRQASVADRLGDWGPLFDRTYAEVEASGGLIVLDAAAGDAAAYASVNRRILDEAVRLAGPGEGQPHVLVAVVWDGTPRGPGDMSRAFVDEARSRSLPLVEISTRAKSYRDKLHKPGPRKLLALDGGGIRGLITIEILDRVEAVLRQAGGNPDLVLADYFDYVAGTSTGAIIAACLALGWPVAKAREFYLKSGPEMFHPARLLERLKYKYNDDKLSRMLREQIGETTLGGAEPETLLMIVMRNATTDSAWPVSNNPAAKYGRPEHPGCNLHLPLWQLVRASTAAPTYFPPEVVEVGPRTFVFVDGGVTMYNNPAFQLFLMATVEPYNLRWPAGEKQMLLVSVGTGTAAAADLSLRPQQMHLLYNASSIPAALMNAALKEQDFLCRVFGRCLVGGPLDREIGAMIDKAGPITADQVPSKLFTYLRYNCDLSGEGLNDLLGPDHRVRPEDVQPLDSIQHLGDLQAIGRAAAVQVMADHFADFRV